MASELCATMHTLCRRCGRLVHGSRLVTITPKRLESVAFAQPCCDSDQCLSMLKATKINRLKDAADKTIRVDTGSTRVM